MFASVLRIGRALCNPRTQFSRCQYMRSDPLRSATILLPDPVIDVRMRSSSTHPTDVPCSHYTNTLFHFITSSRSASMRVHLAAQTRLGVASVQLEHTHAFCKLSQLVMKCIYSVNPFEGTNRCLTSYDTVLINKVAGSWLAMSISAKLWASSLFDISDYFFPRLLRHCITFELFKHFSFGQSRPRSRVAQLAAHYQRP